MTNRPTRALAVFAAVAALGLGGGVPAAMARHGADDPAGHDAGDDHGIHEIHHHHRGDAHKARHRNDDRGRHNGRHHRRQNDDRGRHNGRDNDDGPNHT